MMDGGAVIHQVLQFTPVLQVLSHNKFVVKIDGLFIPCEEEEEEEVACRTANTGPGAESFTERRLDEATGDRLGVSCLHRLPHLSSTSSLIISLHSAEAATVWMVSRPAVMLLKASGAAMSQLWGERALPLAGCHVAPVT